MLVVNVGSRTRGANTVKGVWDHSMTSRPINELLGKVVAKENDMKAKGIIPNLAVCGAGAAGIEMSMAFKARWEKFFGQPIKITVLCEQDTVMKHEQPAAKDECMRALKNLNI